jgi:hypothetical protein
LLDGASIIVRWQGQFGNQLFQYCLGHILNLETGRSVRFPKDFHKDGVVYRNLWRPKSLPGTRISPLRSLLAPVLPFDRELATGQVLDRNLLRSERPVVLRGFFQQYAYYREYREIIREEWLPLPLPDSQSVRGDDLYVHVRRVGYDQWATPHEPLERAIESFGNCRRVFVITDRPQDPFHERLRRRYGAIVESGTWSEDFLKLAAARHVVMSQSTFSWWATFLGNARRVVCPVQRGGVWDSHHNIHLMIDDQPRFEYAWFD